MNGKLADQGPALFLSLVVPDIRQGSNCSGPQGVHRSKGKGRSV